jgi:hypothetical protein
MEIESKRFLEIFEIFEIFKKKIWILFGFFLEILEIFDFFERLDFFFKFWDIFTNALNHVLKKVGR